MKEERRRWIQKEMQKDRMEKRGRKRKAGRKVNLMNG
jgi:hypothetical protein